jgi:hypothetical protein
MTTLRVWVGRMDTLVLPHLHRCSYLELVL